MSDAKRAVQRAISGVSELAAILAEAVGTVTAHPADESFAEIDPSEWLAILDVRAPAAPLVAER